MLRCHKRKYDKFGKEIEPNFSETRKVNIGHLNSSYSKSLFACDFWQVTGKGPLNIFEIVIIIIQ
jgi:hypothetical protein